MRSATARSGCPTGTKARRINVEGPAGPAGPTGPTGPTGPAGPAGPGVVELNRVLRASDVGYVDVDTAAGVRIAWKCTPTDVTILLNAAEPGPDLRLSGTKLAGTTVSGINGENYISTLSVDSTAVAFDLSVMVAGASDSASVRVAATRDGTSCSLSGQLIR